MTNSTAEVDVVDSAALLRCLVSLKKGDFSVRLPVHWTGTAGKIADTLNEVIERNARLAGELERISLAVGVEGKVNHRVSLGSVTGSWATLEQSVNALIDDLVRPTMEMARVIGAVANGDLTQSVSLDIDGRPLQGQFLRAARTVDTMVDQLNAFTTEVIRVAREVGTEGKLGGQADIPGVAGTWKDLTDNVNLMAGNLTAQVRNIAEVTTAVAKGDLSKKITVDVKGEILDLKNTINTMVDQLSSFASEVTRVAREVGTEGKLGGQADVKGIAGTWKDLTDNVNLMGGNLTAQVRNIAEVTTAVANGDLSKKITVDVKGEILDLKDTINTMVDQLSSFASEVTRVAREVGTEGKLGGQADVKGVAGTWKDLTDNVNLMAGNLTAQVRNIAEVTTAVANGDLSKKITVDVKGEILDLKDTINTMVDQLNAFASEVTRVAREVGTEGKLGGQADVKGASGTWRDLTDNVNSMASNLTSQVRNIAEVTTAVAKGDLSKKITVDVRGEMMELKETINTMVDQLRSFASEVTRVAREVGTEGRLGGQANVFGVAGTWKDLTDNVNLMASNLTSQVRNIAAVTTAVANGNLAKKITVDVKGEMLELKDTINTMVDQLNAFANEVSRVAREVGTEGKLGGQAQVKGVAGTWKDLTDNVNLMASNLTEQVRGIARVVTGVASGDLRQKLQLQAKGEIAALADTINGMIDTLATFADQVTSVAREVGVEGKLGGQASVPGAAGFWKALTDNVNQLAENLTTQVRAIAEVATAVTKGDLTRSIRVEARGEVAALKDNINEMIDNLRETTQKSSDQDWLKTNLARFTRMLQGQRDLIPVSRLILSELAPLVGAHQGAFYLMDSSSKSPQLRLLAGYAYGEEGSVQTIALGEGLVGQCAREGKGIMLVGAPCDYLHISSGLGSAGSVNVIVLPVLFEGHVKAVIELASLSRFNAMHEMFLDQLTESIGIVINTIEANMRTEELLKQSQSLAGELQSQQEELQQTNAQLEEKARLLADQKSEVEQKNREVEQAKVALEEKATQLALTSKYKSEFLANMSHELRTPLNSLLILAHQLSDNPEGNLTEKQVKFARTIHGSGTDLMGLINDILDLSKIESGTVTIEIDEVLFSDLREFVDRTFRHVADDKGLVFEIELDEHLPFLLTTDSKRLRQVIKNLLSNAFKFTQKGRVSLAIRRVASGWSHDHASLNAASGVVAISVTDTGIGIPAEKQRLIFEAFQQADGSTARKYGGTGLGLSISREIAHLLGGELTLRSRSGEGSIFTLYIPDEHPSLASRSRFLPGKSGADDGTWSRSLPAPRLAIETTDDSVAVDAGHPLILIVENETRFAQILIELAHEAGLKGVVATRGDAAFALARQLKPAAVTLDLRLPDMSGDQVLEKLKTDAETRDIPVHVISGVTEGYEHVIDLGAASYWLKPVDASALKQLLSQIEFAGRRRRVVVGSTIAEDIADLGPLVEEHDGRLDVVASGAEVLASASEELTDCIIIPPELSDMPAEELIDRLSATPNAQRTLIFIAADADTPDERLSALKQSALRPRVQITDDHARLCDEVGRLLRPPVFVSTAAHDAKLKKAEPAELAQLAGKRVLVVDDDVRNIFALTSLLERYEIEVLFADNGRDAITMLQETESIEIVLMDIMMPDMDGFQAIHEIRSLEQFARLPIIALTARAMKGDREKCIEAGASDYVPKPVAPDQLLSVLCAWAGCTPRVDEPECADA